MGRAKKEDNIKNGQFLPKIVTQKCVKHFLEPLDNVNLYTTGMFAGDRFACSELRDIHCKVNGSRDRGPLAIPRLVGALLYFLRMQRWGNDKGIVAGYTKKGGFAYLSLDGEYWGEFKDEKLVFVGCFSPLSVATTATKDEWDLIKGMGLYYVPLIADWLHNDSKFVRYFQRFVRAAKYTNTGEFVGDADEFMKATCALCDYVYYSGAYEPGVISNTQGVVLGSPAAPVYGQLDTEAYKVAGLIGANAELPTEKKTSFLLKKSDTVERFDVDTLQFEVADKKQDTSPEPSPKSAAPKFKFEGDWDPALIPAPSKRVSEETKKVSSLILKSYEMGHPVNKILMSGPAGSGKTTTVRDIAAKLGLPYYFMVCHADTTGLDLTSQAIPDSNGGFRFVESPLITAFRNGGVFELQEPTMGRPDTMSVLNSMLDDCAAVTLMTGEKVLRNKNFLMFATLNLDYVGCRPMNQALLSRFQLKLQMNLPDKKVLIERMMANSGLQDKALAERLVKAFCSCCRVVENQGLTDSSLDVRALIAWATCCQVVDDPMEAAEFTIINSSTFDEQGRMAVRTNLKQFF